MRVVRASFLARRMGSAWLLIGCLMASVLVASALISALVNFYSGALPVFTGTGTGVPVRIEPGFLVGVALGLVALAALTLAAQTTIAGRNTVSALRIGD